VLAWKKHNSEVEVQPFHLPFSVILRFHILYLFPRTEITLSNEEINLKKPTATIIALSILCGVLASALAYSWLYTLVNEMGIGTVKSCQIEKPLGTKISTYGWGNNFCAVGASRTEVFWIRSTSNCPINITCSVSGLHSAWSVTLNQTRFEFPGFSYNQHKPFEVTLTLINMQPPTGPAGYNFDLEFGEE